MFDSGRGECLPIPNNTRRMLPNIVKPIKIISRKIISRKPKNPNIVISFFIYHVQQACHVYCLRSFFS